MPLTKDITFKCPECGEEIPLTLWQSVNTAENPKEAEALAYGDLFYIQCPKCGYQTMANYSLLYHDVEHGMMIQYIATPDREERAKEMAEYRKARKDSIEAALRRRLPLCHEPQRPSGKGAHSPRRARRPLCGTREGLHHAAGRQHEAGPRDRIRAVLPR